MRPAWSTKRSTNERSSSEIKSPTPLEKLSTPSNLPLSLIGKTPTWRTASRRIAQPRRRPPHRHYHLFGVELAHGGCPVLRTPRLCRSRWRGGYGATRLLRRPKWGRDGTWLGSGATRPREVHRSPLRNELHHGLNEPGHQLLNAPGQTERTACVLEGPSASCEALRSRPTYPIVSNTKRSRSPIVREK